MTSFVISSTDKKRRVAYIDGYCRELGIDKYDVTLIEKDSSSKTISSIGIDEIKDLHKNIFLKPINSAIKAVILEDAHLLTTEAQNALLKVLEEPPEHTIIILGTETTEALVPTILSRCQVIELPTENTVLTDIETAEYEDFISKLSAMKIGDRLKKAEELSKDKDLAIEWIGKLILVLRERLLADYSQKNNFAMKQPASPAGRFSNETIRSFQNLHNILKTTNVNPRFAIENTLLNINS